MGWLRGIQDPKYERNSSEQSSVAYTRSKQNIKHVEDIEDINVAQLSVGEENETPYTKSYPLQEPTVPDDKLPFIPAEIIKSKRKPGALAVKLTSAENKKDYWIVVDDVVYNCTTFVPDHPGGEQVILSFVGEDCSWQFWRFHGKKEMEQYGRALRIGRTQGVANRFPEPVRFVGLSKLGSDDW